MGVVGAASGDPALLRQADLVLLLGAAADYRVGYLEPPALDPAAALVRVEVEPRRLAAGRQAHVGIAADPADFLVQLHEACSERQMGGFEEWLADAAGQRDGFCRQILDRARRGDGLHALDIVEALDRCLGPEAALVLDGGSIGQWFHQTLGRRRYPAHWLTCGASAMIGFGIAGAMAARLCFPRRPVVLLTGDGSATFNITELECASRQGLPFVVVVADDESWGISASGQQRQYGELMHTRLGPVDFAGLAQSLGALGTRVSSREELEAALGRGVQERLPVVIQAPIVGGMPGE
jgi:acetolactate synthase-1/2/3 large subunit